MSRAACDSFRVAALFRLRAALVSCGSYGSRGGVWLLAEFLVSAGRVSGGHGSWE